MRNKWSIVVSIIIGLAVVGLVSQLLTNTVNFLIQIFIAVAVGAVVFAAIYFLVLRNVNQPNNDMKKYRQAVKQSKQKYKKQKSTRLAKTEQKKPIVRRVRKHAPHLRVIEGNKSIKRRNRAN